MKKLPLILSILALAGVIALAVITLTKGNTKKAEPAATEANANKGAIVYFNMDRVVAEYDLANDLRSVVETKVNSISQSTAQAQYQKLQEQDASFQNYAAEKQQEIAEEQQVMLNQIFDAIKTFVDEYNETMGYAMILVTQGDILPAPVVTGEASLDITDALIEGLNAAYVKEKGKTE